MKFRHLLAPCAAVVLTTACAQAQGPAPMPGQPTATPNADGSITVSSGRPSRALGFTFGGTPARGADGRMRWAEHPVVRTVIEGSNAQLAGLQVGDVLLTVNGRDAREVPLFVNRTVGTEYVVMVRRGRVEEEVRFEIGSASASR